MMLHRGLGSALLLHVASAGAEGPKKVVTRMPAAPVHVPTASELPSTARGWPGIKNREESAIYPTCKLTS